MKTKYRTWMSEVQKVEIERETESFVWIKGRKNAKRSEWESFFDTFNEAKEHLMDGARRKVLQLTSQLEMANDKLIKINSLTE